MLGFYAIRKLIEATKFTDVISNQYFDLIAYPATGKNVSRTNWHHFWELYDLELPEQVRHDLLFLCHQFVHSYVFMPSFSDTKEFVAILVSSDRERLRYLYQLEIKVIIRLF